MAAVSPLAAPNFLFIRHGETDWNAEGRLQGQLDIPLNALGRDQALDAGRRVAAVLQNRGQPIEDTRFVASPLGRARATMERARSALGLSPEGYDLDDRLREFSFGAWEGLTWPEVKSRDPALLRERRRDKWNFVPPGGESYAMLAERVLPWLATVRAGTVVVSHGGVARAIMVLMGALSRAAAPETEILQGRVLCLDRGRAIWL